MPVRNRRPDLNGVLVVDKPLGWSSAKACAVVRRVTGGAKVGHAGTLDPLATGVLVLALGRATKRIADIQATGKRYHARLDLSRFTTTDDAEGEPLAIGELDPATFGVRPLRPEPASEHDLPPTLALIEHAIAERFVGDLDQRPPDFSAVKVGGRRAYALARSGAQPDIKPKRVRIDRIDLIDYDWPTLELAIACGKGTYIRSLARDLGLTLGVGGTLTALRRTAVGPFDESLALASLDEADEAAVVEAMQRAAPAVDQLERPGDDRPGLRDAGP